MIRIATFALLGALAGCSPGAPGNSDAGMANRSILADAPDNAGVAEAAPKSILRPDVAAPEPEKPTLQPIERVIAFGASGLELDDAGRAALDGLLADPVMAAGGRITLSGHSDTRGSDGDNRVASRRRAEAVRAYLVEKGVAADRITLIALGETRPVAPNAKPDGSDDPEGRAKNRRVEIRVDLPLVQPVTVPVEALSNESAG